MPRKKNSASKNASTKAPFGSKSAFVRGLPSEMPAKEVVAKAKQEGLKLSVGQVYNIRSVSKRRSSKRPGKKARQTRAGAVAAPTDGAEQRLRKLIAEVGLSRTREMMAEIAEAFRS